MEISNTEVLRYLGYRGGEADKRVCALIKEISVMFAENTAPKSVYGVWDCHVDLFTTTLAYMSINSAKLAEHLAGCRRVALLAITLGPEADTLIRRYSVQDMEKAVIAQALCAVMIEAYCNKIKNELTQRFKIDGLYPTAPFSPGYGDFNIAHQKDILNLLNCDRRIGLTLTDGYMLVPSKSITAVIGFTKEKDRACTGENCGRCDAGHCGFREVK